MKKIALLMAFLISDFHSFAATPVISPSTAYVYVGLYTHFTADTAGGVWSTSNSSVATVNSTSGMLIGVTVGTVNVVYKKGATTVTKNVTVNATPTAIVDSSTNVGSVIINGNFYARGYLGSKYSINVSTGDTLIGLNYQFVVPTTFINDAKASTYLNGDNSNTPFASMAALQAWMIKYFEVK